MPCDFWRPEKSSLRQSIPRRNRSTAAQNFKAFHALHEQFAQEFLEPEFVGTCDFQFFEESYILHDVTASFFNSGAGIKVIQHALRIVFDLGDHLAAEIVGEIRIGLDVEMSSGVFGKSVYDTPLASDSGEIGAARSCSTTWFVISMANVRRLRLELMFKNRVQNRKASPSFFCEAKRGCGAKLLISEVRTHSERLYGQPTLLLSFLESVCRSLFLW